MKKFLVAIVIIWCGFAVLSAEVFEHQGGGISIWFPNDWTITPKQDALNAEAPDKDAFAHLFVLKDVRDMEDAIDIYAEELESIISDFETTTEGQEIEMNGLSFFVMEGTGYVEDVKLEIGVALILTPKTFVIMVTANTPESNIKYERDFKEIVQSIQALH